MGKMPIGPIKTQGQYYVPSPEPLEKLGNTLAMSAAYSLYGGSALSEDEPTSGKKSGSKEDYGNILPSYELALRQQKRGIDYKAKAIKQSAMDALKNEYHGDVKKFLEGEQLKYKNGEGYYAQKEQLLALEDIYATNKTTAILETDKFKAAEKAMTDNSAEGLYYIDPATGARVIKGKDKVAEKHILKTESGLIISQALLG